ncbi:MAG: DUF4148 domain-containing protein [Hydrogenophaga sp.]|uniref:DUF4148 domain-containing protein n=1 Tax=Hydrogenophaga sp. TaxID=1904254 RepID=UPI001DF2F65B|nr:DUF4148 domain-containing protein [Hydrogenophaga sp.]MBX3609156.1 DUF4148 domain-containing protein [Hydrogenophaga sp.]
MKSALLPLVLAISAGAAFAEGPIEGNEVFNFQSQLTRAEVQAQVAPAYKADVIARGEASEGQDQATVVASNLSVAQVRAEAAEAYRLGLVAQGEILPVPTAAQVEQVRLAGVRAVQGNAVAQGAAATVAN